MVKASKSSPYRRVVGPPKDPQKSRITNGSALLPGVDGRCAWIRRAKDLISLHLADIPNASTAVRSLVRRACVMTVELERIEQRFALADEASAEDLDLYQKTSNSLRRLLQTIGLERRAKDITPPSLSAYLSNRSAAE
jgi:hypothetical protein